jgi:tryptophan-rich sensory protein
LKKKIFSQQMSDALAVFLRLVGFGGSISLISRFVYSSGGGFSNVGNHVPLRPPQSVFSWAWSILFITTGVAWALAKDGRADILLAVVTLLCCLWLVAFALYKKKKIAAIILVVTLATLILATVHVTGASTWLLIPLDVWLAFATYLNLYDAFSPTKPQIGTENVPASV